MARTGSTDTSPNDMVYNPPRLPACLSDAHPLEPIVGVPNDEEIKAIHAAIRAVNGILNVPALYDPDLPTQLAQHLFQVQMAVYRSEYGFTILPGSMTYTPPTLPSHIAVALEPVVGAPSDGEIKLAQSAVRVVESLANSPSIFDPDLSMKLSQHLFNIQAARYIQDVSQGQFASEPLQERSEPFEMRSDPGSVPSFVDMSAAESLNDTRNAPEHAPPEAPAWNFFGQPSQPSVLLEDAPEIYPRPTLSPAPHATRDTNHSPEVTYHMFCDIRATLKNINMTLISTQHSLVRSASTWNRYAQVNQKGELPSKQGLPHLRASKYRETSNGSYYHYLDRSNDQEDLSDVQLATYLRFYNIGMELIEDRSGEPVVVPDRKEEAERLLYKHLHELPGSCWAGSS